METIGVKGKKCLDYIEVLKQLVNARITDTQYTQEFYETENTVSTDNNQEIRFD